MTKKQIKYTSRDITKFQSNLEQMSPDNHWLDVLETCSHTGVASVRQLVTATPLSRDKLRSLLKRFGGLTVDDAILPCVSLKVPRPGVRGRPSTLYKLGRVGAALLRANGHPNAHACGLNDARTIAHARAVLDVRLAAEAAGLTVQTERELAYTTSDGERGVLRPDALVTLPGGIRIIFELEQVAMMSLLRRIVAILRRKVLFFQSEEASDVSSTVRVVINLPHGRDWDKTIAVWERAVAIVAEENGGKLPFEVVAMPLEMFLATPDWTELPNERRWEPLFDPALVSTFTPALPDQNKDQTLVPTKKGQRSTTMTAQQEILPDDLKRRSAQHDYLIMGAFWQHLLEHGPSLMHTYDRPRPDHIFFDVMTVVYAASHPPDATPWEMSLHPHASLYLLRRYLMMHKDLGRAISKAIARGGGSMRWSTPTITHRVQVIIDLFLRYHGFRSSGSLRASTIGPWERSDHRGDFGIRVHLDPEMLMGDGDGVVPSRDEAKQAADALAWVLRALLAYGEDLGLKQATFW